MKLAIDSLTETPVAFQFTATPQWFRERFAGGAAPREGLSEALAIEGRAYRAAADVLVEGSVRGEVELGCSRCLRRYRAPVREPFRLVLEPAGARVPADPEGAEALSSDGVYLGDEAETGWFRGQEIRLDRFIGEVISLALPMQPLCREECKGLCPRCGVDRNAESCNCAESRPESPFAVLSKLKRPGPAPQS
ncbi:MAG: DUF177 domain-containing protein [Deltaproteobacteria bacterium]|nr:DUF177 domain-containing protein [Deltaproteobacteria bacterium]